VDGDRAMAFISRRSVFVDGADVRAFGIEGGIRLRGQPVADAVRLEVSLFFKKRPTERCETFGTRPRLMASSAISRWLHWLIGRPFSDGFWRFIAPFAKICGAVYVGGFPDRGASASRSPAERPPVPCCHRFRQYRAVFGHTPTS